MLGGVLCDPSLVESLDPDSCEPDASEPDGSDSESEPSLVESESLSLSLPVDDPDAWLVEVDQGVEPESLSCGGDPLGWLSSDAELSGDEVLSDSLLD